MTVAMFDGRSLKRFDQLSRKRGEAGVALLQLHRSWEHTMVEHAAVFQLQPLDDLNPDLQRLSRGRWFDANDMKQIGKPTIPQRQGVKLLVGHLAQQSNVTEQEAVFDQIGHDGASRLLKGLSPSTIRKQSEIRFSHVNTKLLAVQAKVRGAVQPGFVRKIRGIGFWPVIDLKIVRPTWTARNILTGGRMRKQKGELMERFGE